MAVWSGIMNRPGRGESAKEASAPHGSDNVRQSVFTVLRAEGLNRLRIHHDWRAETFRLYAAREWDAGTSFRSYNRTFTAQTLCASHTRALGHTEVEDAFARYGLREHLAAIQSLMRKGRHMLLDCYDHALLDIRFVNHVHSDRRGLNNGLSSVVMGGIRRHDPDEPELAVFVDGMNLGRGMSFKNVAAGLPMGGCKTTVQMAPVDLDDLDQVGFLAFATDRTRNTAGPDMGFPPELTDVVKRHFSTNFTGGPAGPLGPTGTPTAYGVHAAVKQAAEFLWGSDDLSGRTIAVQGLGAVGFPLASHYLRDGARLVVAERSPANIEALRAAHPGADIRVVAPEDILGVEADILSPAAGGGILSMSTIPRLRVAMVVGGANNVLEASSEEEELALARLMDLRGILYQVDWWHNIGGVMAGYEEYVHRDDASKDRLMNNVRRRCAEGTRENLNEARREGITPTERAYRTVASAVYGDSQDGARP